MPQPMDYIRAARVPVNMQDVQVGPWNVKRRPWPAPERDDTFKDYTVLAHHNIAGMNKIDDEGWGGDVVMEDGIFELRKHLPIWLNGTGRILKTGLGMGCVVRGLLIKDDVEHIDVIEIDQRVIDLFGPEFKDNPRVTIHHGDALKWQMHVDMVDHWDYAWHDIWCEGNDGLDVLHTKLLTKYLPFAKVQGAWNYPRWAGRLLDTQLLGAPSHKRKFA